MTLVESPLLMLPVHLSSEAAYNTRVDRLVAEKKAEVERVSKMPFDQQPIGAQIMFLDIGLPSPWLLNYVIGWLVLGLDDGRSLTGDVYCRWKDMPRKMLDRTYRRTIIANNQWTHWGELSRSSVQWFGDNTDYANALVRLAEEGREQLRSHRPSWRHCEVWLPPFGLECINWVEAIRQAKGRK